MENRTQQAGETKKPKRKTEYKEAELMLLFNIKRINSYHTPLMKEWLAVENPVFDAGEQYNFDRKFKEVTDNIYGWGEEDLKVKFIYTIVELGHLIPSGNIVTFLDKTVSATVKGIKLTVKPDFIMAKGLLNVLQNPYFHFHEYKPEINPTGEPMAQLLQAFLIAQVTNKDGNPLYGIEIIGSSWRFVIMEGNEYCVSKSFDCTEKEDLLKIIAIMRKFKHILETRLMVYDEL